MDLRDAPVAIGPGTRAVGYVLASGRRSWDGEVRRMRAVAGRWGWSLVRTWEEEPDFAVQNYRPAFAAVVTAIEQGQAGVVMVPDAATLSGNSFMRCRMIRRIEAGGARVSVLPGAGGPAGGWRA